VLHPEEQDPPKRWYSTTSLHDVTTQKTTNWIVSMAGMQRWYLRFCLYLYERKLQIRNVKEIILYAQEIVRRSWRRKVQNAWSFTL